MPLTPGYGETPGPRDEADLLLPKTRELLGRSMTKADVYDLEQAVQAAVTEDVVEAVLDGTITVVDVVTDRFLRSLHTRLYGDIWTWAGRLRQRELNIGVAPERAVVVEDAAAGVQGAHRAGMVAIGVGPHHADLGADRSAESLAELPVETFRDLVLAASELA